MNQLLYHIIHISFYIFWKYLLIAATHSPLMLKVSKCLPFSCLFFSVCLLFIWNGPIPIAVVIWALEQCFRMLWARRRQAFCRNDGRSTVREKDDESSFFFLTFPLDLFLLSVSPSPFLLCLDYRHQAFWVRLYLPIPTAVKKQRRRSQSATTTPHPHPYTHSPLFFPFTVSLQTLSQFGGCGSSANFCTGAFNVSWHPLWRERERGWR